MGSRRLETAQNTLGRIMGNVLEMLWIGAGARERCCCGELWTGVQESVHWAQL